MMDTVQSIPQPVVARVHALATAAGCQLVATCDLAVAAESASFAIPGGKGGLFCHTPLVAVARNVGRKRALEMALTGDPIDARTAADWGLINRVVPDADLDAEVAELVRRATRGSALAKALGKHGFYAQVDLDQPKAYRYAVESDGVGGDDRATPRRGSQRSSRSAARSSSSALTDAGRRAHAGDERRSHRGDRRVTTVADRPWRDAHLLGDRPGEPVRTRWRIRSSPAPGRRRLARRAAPRRARRSRCRDRSPATIRLNSCGDRISSVAARRRSGLRNAWNVASEISDAATWRLRRRQSYRAARSTPRRSDLGRLDGVAVVAVARRPGDQPGRMRWITTRPARSSSRRAGSAGRAARRRRGRRPRVPASGRAALEVGERRQLAWRRPSGSMEGPGSARRIERGWRRRCSHSLSRRVAEGVGSRGVGHGRTLRDRAHRGPHSGTATRPPTSRGALTAGSQALVRAIFDRAQTCRIPSGPDPDPPSGCEGENHLRHRRPRRSSLHGQPAFAKTTPLPTSSPRSGAAARPGSRSAAGRRPGHSGSSTCRRCGWGPESNSGRHRPSRVANLRSRSR